MAKTLDFSRLKVPVLSLVMNDEEKTKIEVCVPSVALIEELEATLPLLQETLKGESYDVLRSTYEFTAKLVSCNVNGITVTGEELRDKYNINEKFLIIFYQAYLDFIEESTKN